MGAIRDDPGRLLLCRGPFRLARTCGDTYGRAPAFQSRRCHGRQVALAQTIGPAAVIDFSGRAAKDPDAVLGVVDIEQYELSYGRIPDGAIVVARSGWGRFWSDPKRYMGTDQTETREAALSRFFRRSGRLFARARRDRACDRHGEHGPGKQPGFSGSSAMAGRQSGRVRKFVQYGQTSTRSEQSIFCAPLKIGGGSGSPARIFALLP